MQDQDLIGINGRRYLDRTGHLRHRASPRDSPAPQARPVFAGHLPGGHAGPHERGHPYPRRYDTASNLARDVERFLKDEPVETRPPAATYRLRKLFRRNKVAVLTTAAIAAALVLGTAISAWQAVRATRAEAEARRAEDQATHDRDRAQDAEAKAKNDKEAALDAEAKAKREKETAQATLDFLWQDMRSHTIPLLDSDRDLKLRTLLDRVTARLEHGSGKPPLVEASIRQMIGQLYLDIGGGPLSRGHRSWGGSPHDLRHFVEVGNLVAHRSHEEDRAEQ